ncbi:hypothetical protein F4808DRAFT_299333 [Astrocystis sublimbata]|nr:hypothetical protein F4808DRAFT_299333 [Astrocystis sublimbata]
MSPGLVQQNEGLEESGLEPVAICGMACRLPGGVDSDSSFWQMLVEKRSGQTPRVPESRFNIDAHYHENLARPGSFNVAGGYFLDGRPDDFDPTFFNITPIEAQWLDPQQRKMLEVTYECLVSAGVTLDAITGSSTAVFVGSFTADYQQLSTREPDFRHNYAATGIDPGIISNRISNVFNLHGPSFTINTACSSSIYALHNACHALRSRDCDAAIVGGVNLIITVDQQMNTAKLGILSPTSTCHTFDASADGYGRAEGAGALYVKRLSDAIRDGDPIRGVVRATAVNTNGKVEGMGITHPSKKGQESVVRLAYQKAKLDPNQTAYAELHGTGTPVGDPIEVHAISRALNDTRSTDKPLLVGAVKPNIGHSEAASGVFAVMKAALMTETSTIPGVAHFQNLNPDIKEKEWNVKVHANTAPWPTDFSVRRASVSSFGYGGTNGHVIIESIDSLCPWYKHGAKKSPREHRGRDAEAAHLICFSAHDKATLSRNIAAVSKVAHQYHLSDLAYTLNLRRTKFAHRAYVVAREGREAEAFALAASQTGTAAKTLGSMGFLFTGQGAQWIGMGRVALQKFPIILDTIQHLDRIVNKIHPKPSFSMVELLLTNDESMKERINEAEVAQPLCTAIQIALVELFAQWNITPEVSIGHSSGEIGAAYAAGLISAPEAILAAVCRGRAVTQHSPSGTMLAVGLGVQEVEKYVTSFTSNDVCIACENSPGSVTLSGREEPIARLKDILTRDAIFARELPTGRAYHSQHMAPVGKAYDNMLAQALDSVSQDDLSWRRPRSCMISSVTGDVIDNSVESLQPGYWSANLRNRVLFNTAVQHLGTHDAFKTISHVVEIGPHSALAGPFKQISYANETIRNRIAYVSSLKRNENDVDRLLGVAGSLFLAGHKVDLGQVAFSSGSGSKNETRKQKTKNLLVDLPPYQWNYEKRYWAESRASAELRARSYLRHDLLGSRVPGLSQKLASWRNILRQRDVPWLKDHNLGGTTIFPAAGHLSLAIEALRQVCETSGKAFQGVKLRDVDLKTALVVPDEDDGVEVMLNLQAPTEQRSSWYNFSVESPGADGQWTVHCNGRISATGEKSNNSPNEVPVDKSTLTQRVSGKRWYDAFRRVGFYYGKTFQQLRHARTSRTIHHAAGDVTVRECCAEEMQGESRYLIHPSSIDACLQLIIISINAGKHKEMPFGVVPTRIEEVSLFPAGLGEGIDVGHAVAWTDGFEGRRFNTNVQLSAGDDRLLMDIKSMTCTAYEAALPAIADDDAKQQDPEPFSIMSWKPDITTLRNEDIDRLCVNVENDAEELAQYVGLIAHRQAISNGLILIPNSATTIRNLPETILEALSEKVNMTIGVIAAEDEEEEIVLSEAVLSRAQKIKLSPEADSWEAPSEGSYDLVIADTHIDSQHTPHPESLLRLIADGGWLACSSQSPSPVHSSATSFSLQTGQHTLLRKAGKPLPSDVASYPDRKERIAYLSLPDDRIVGDLDDLLSNLQSRFDYRETPITEPADGHDLVIVDDSTGAMSSWMLEREPHFNAVKKLLTSGVPILWMTRGARQGHEAGKRGVAGMAEGLLRVVRSEQAASNITLLDMDRDEKRDDIRRAVGHIIDSTTTAGSKLDAEFWLHQGILYTSRVHSRPDLNQRLAQNKLQKVTLDGPLKLVDKTADGQFVFESQPGRKPAALDNGQVEIEVSASGWPSCTPGSRTLALGTVLRGDSATHQDVEGRTAVAFAYDTLETTFSTSAFTVLDNWCQKISHEDILRAMSSLCPLVNLFLVGATLARGDSIVSLPGPEKSIKMFVKLSSVMGWRLSVVTDGEEDPALYASRMGLNSSQVLHTQDPSAVNTLICRQRDLSSSRIVTVLCHNLNNTLSQEAWRQIPPSGRFLLLDDMPADFALDPLPFTRGASFVPSSMKYLRESPNAASSLLAQSLDLLEVHPSLLEIDTTANGMSIVDIEDAVETAQTNRTAEVVRYRPLTSQVWTIPKPKQLRLDPEATYLLVGCLGGLGRSLTKWMMSCGARHFAFMSRSGTDKPEAARLVTDIERAGASTQVIRADVAAGIIDDVNMLHTERPIKGVVHAAMVLKDGMFEQMTYDSYLECINPKATGAFQLHCALQAAGIDPDFFVMTSSISALIGNTGQANYSAANAALDALARQRRAAGLAASSLVLPMVLDVGVVAEDDSIETSLMRKGLYGIDEHEMLRGFETAMLASRDEPTSVSNSKSNTPTNTSEITDASQIIMGMEPRELATAATDDSLDAFWRRDARFAHTLAAIARLQSGGSGGACTANESNENTVFAKSLKAAVSEGGPEAVIRAVSEHVARRLSSILMISSENIDLEGAASIASYGLDSMIGAELRTWLFKEFGLDYPFQKLLASTLTFKTLSAAIVEKMGLQTTTG